VKSGEY
jgi:hypothetical protein